MADHIGKHINKTKKHDQELGECSDDEYKVK